MIAAFGAVTINLKNKKSEKKGLQLSLYARGLCVASP